MGTRKCKDCSLCEILKPASIHNRCAYWGFDLLDEQRACSQFEPLNIRPKDKWHAYPLGNPLSSSGLPRRIVITHDFSNKRHKLIIDTACVNGIWYAGVHYGRQYDCCYGSAHSCSIYDGDFKTERDAINARLRELLKAETFYKCDEACEFLRGLIINTRQLTLFDTDCDK